VRSQVSHKEERIYALKDEVETERTRANKLVYLITQYDSNSRNNNTTDGNPTDNNLQNTGEERTRAQGGGGGGGGSSSVYSRRTTGTSKSSGGGSRLHRTIDGVINMDYHRDENNDNETQRSHRTSSTISTATHNYPLGSRK
jgi:hypothetical protein